MRSDARVRRWLPAVPYFWLLMRGEIRATHRARLLLLPILAAAQGALGWYMVKSGLEVRTDVSPYRLTAHLGMALIIYVVCVWTALELGARPSHGSRTPLVLRREITFGLGLTFVTVLSGGFVAGLDAGRIFNTFPLMGGHVVPPGYLAPDIGWRTAFENPAAAQFHHRVLAISTAALLLVLAFSARRSGGLRRTASAHGARGPHRYAGGRAPLVTVFRLTAREGSAGPSCGHAVPREYSR